MGDWHAIPDVEGWVERMVENQDAGWHGMEPGDFAEALDEGIDHVRALLRMLDKQRKILSRALDPTNDPEDLYG